MGKVGKAERNASFQWRCVVASLQFTQDLTFSSIPRNWTESDVQIYLIVLAARILTTAILRSGEGLSFLIALVEPYAQDRTWLKLSDLPVPSAVRGS
jgi:hypothetical protein